MQIPRIVLPDFLPWQEEVDASPARYKVLCIGRQAGKSTYATIKAMENALKGMNVWWVSPSYRQTRVVWREARKMVYDINEFLKPTIGQDFIDINKTEKIMEFRNGGCLWCRSSDDPDSLRGDTIDYCIFDEAAQHDRYVWDVLRPALTVRDAKALFLSTPRGKKNWFYDLWLRGQEPNQTQYQSWLLPSSVNPVITAERMEEMKRDMPEDRYREEVLCEFTDEASCVFRGFRECIAKVDQDKAVDNHRYILGVDLGRTKDSTAIVVLDTTIDAIVYLERFTQIDYVVQRNYLMEVIAKFHPFKIVVEANSVGQPFIEALRRMPGVPPIIPFYTTNKSKNNAIETLQLAFAHQQMQIIDNPVIVDELLSFSVHRSPSGNLIYGAMPGKHDDTIIAMALAVYEHKKPSNQIYTFDRSLVGI